MGAERTDKSPTVKPVESDSTGPGEKPATQNPPREEPRKIYHVVVEGDTLWRIAKAYEVDQEEIMKANGLKDATVEVGQRLHIPGAIEPVEVKSYRPPRAGKKFVRGESFGYPCVGRVALGFGQWRGGQKTEGADFSVGRGAKAVAARTGEVVFVEKSFPGYGLVVILQHGPQYRTFYGYLAETPVQVGDAVAKGEVIGVAGAEPRGGESRLHFRIYDGTRPVNPLERLR